MAALRAPDEPTGPSPASVFVKGALNVAGDALNSAGDGVDELTSCEHRPSFLRGSDCFLPDSNRSVASQLLHGTGDDLKSGNPVRVGLAFAGVFPVGRLGALRGALAKGAEDAASGLRGSRATATVGTNIVKYDADAAIGRIAGGQPATASDLAESGAANGWARSQTASGPLKYTDENGITRLTIKSGSVRTRGSNFPHVEIRNASGQRVDPYGNPVNRRSPGNHTPIIWDLP
jgi:hypothetical protein